MKLEINNELIATKKEKEKETYTDTYQTKMQTMILLDYSIHSIITPTYQFVEPIGTSTHNILLHVLLFMLV